MSNDAGNADTTTVQNPGRELPRIPGHQVTRLLGEGGMASVYLATDVRLKRQVAIKTMSGVLSADPQFRLRFADEATTVAGLRHPNIVTVFSSGESDGQLYIVMEYVPGGTLADRLAAGRLGVTPTLEICCALLRALQHFHGLGIVHRDLKPGNILFMATGEPVLSDFGIAKALDADSSRTTIGSVIGSPKYMAPEQLQGNPATDRADVYSFGLVMLEMLNGALPPRDVTTIHSPKHVGRLRRTLPAAARRCTGLLARCLAAEPADRPSASECLAIAKALAARPDTQRTWLVPAAVGLAALLTAGMWLLGREPGTEARNVLDEPTTRTAPAEQTPPAPPAQDIVLPSFTEFSEFTAFDADAPPGRRLPAFSYPPYRELMMLRAAWLEGGAPAITDDVARLRARADAGDAEARVTLFLAAEGRLIGESPADLLAGLKAASADGHALATFYYALYFRREHETEGALDRRSMLELRDLYALAARQGLTFANAEVEDADRALAE